MSTANIEEKRQKAILEKNARMKTLLNSVDKYTLLSDAYYGTGGFADGAYLVPHRRESASKYKTRQDVAYYLNYVAPVVNSHVDPVFKNDPVRDWAQGNALWEKFMEDCDFTGKAFHKFMKRAGLVAKLKGVAFIVIDNVTTIPQSLKVQLDERAFPYLYIVMPEDVKNYKTNRLGQLTEITYSEPPDETENNDTGKMNERTWTRTESILKNNHGDELNRVPHSLGRVPVVPLFSREVGVGDMKPQSEFYSIARANARIYNLCSELDEILRNQAFSILTYPGANPGGNNSELQIGTETILGYNPQSSTSPSFIAPPSDPAKLVMEQIDRLIKEIYRMAALDSVVGVQEKASGVAKQWDYEKTNQMLADFASNCENVEKQIALLFGAWTSTDVGYTVTYSDDFGIEDVMAELDEAVTALTLNVGGAFNAEVKKRVAGIMFADLPEDRFKAIEDDIDQAAQDEKELAEAQKELNTIKNDQLKKNPDYLLNNGKPTSGGGFGE